MIANATRDEPAARQALGDTTRPFDAAHAATATAACGPLFAMDPDTVGPYRLLGRLGAGGMGVVYLGEHSTGALAAVKVVREELSLVAEFRARFAREVGVGASVRSRYTAAVVGSDLQARQQWVASEYIPGPTLAEYIESHGPLPTPDALRVCQ